MYFFCLEYAQSNVAKILRRMDSFEDVDVCFDENPYKPFLLANVQIDSEHLK